MKAFGWPLQSPDLNVIWIENIQADLKYALHAMQLKNTSELEEFCKEEWE